MKHEDFENEMFAHVNRNCKMKELDRQEIARAAQEEYRIIRKCKKVNATIGIILWIACFATFTFAFCVLSWLGDIPAQVATVATALAGLVAGINVNSLANRIKK